MTETDDQEIQDLRRHIDRMLLWIGGAFLTISLAVIGWSLEQERRMSQVEATVQQNTRAKESARSDRAAIRQQAAIASREVGGLAVKLDAQAGTLNEIRQDISSLRRYLQERNDKP